MRSLVLALALVGCGTNTAAPVRPLRLTLSAQQGQIVTTPTVRWCFYPVTATLTGGRPGDSVTWRESTFEYAKADGSH